MTHIKHMCNKQIDLSGLTMKEVTDSLLFSAKVDHHHMHDRQISNLLNTFKVCTINDSLRLTKCDVNFSFPLKMSSVIGHFNVQFVAWTFLQIFGINDHSNNKPCLFRFAVISYLDEGASLCGVAIYVTCPFQSSTQSLF